MPKNGTGRPRGRPAMPLERKRALGLVSNATMGVLANALPTAGGVIPPVPGSLNEAGAELWERLWVGGRAWLSAEADVPMMTLLCQAADEAAQIRELFESGRVERFYRSSNGTQATHPLVTQLKELRVQMTSWLSALGFSPADRARLGIAVSQEPDFMAVLAARREARLRGE